MKEDFLAYVWLHQHLDHTVLRTHTGEAVNVLRTGFLNTDSGPDFLEARIEIGGILWIGSIELHVRSSDWNGHGHYHDPAYQNVILHVVWENDLGEQEYPNSRYPVLELKNYVPPDLLARYRAIQETLEDFPCENQFADIRELEKKSMLDKVLIERLERKADTVLKILQANRGDWEETTWQLLARYFGARINAESFQKLAEFLPIRVLLRHRDNLLQLEALLFGTAGLIPGGESCSYIRDLRREYEFLSRKYQFGAHELRPLEWKLLRLRPAGFPTVRIAQLASLVQRNGNLFSTLTNFQSVQDLTRSLRSIQSPYWHTHYHFGKAAETLVPLMGTEAIHLLIINAAVPLLAAFAYRTDDRHYLEKAVRVLEELPVENNRITRKWKSLGMKLKTAACSQGATEWYQFYCEKKNCLHCMVGNAILGHTVQAVRDDEFQSSRASPTGQ